MKSFLIPPVPENLKEEAPLKRFVVERYGNDGLLEANLNRLFHEGYELRYILYDEGLKRGPWGVVLENTSVNRQSEPLSSPPDGVDEW